MKLYKGSNEKLEKIVPVELHITDYHKFPKDNIPKNVIWATGNKRLAFIHALMRSIGLYQIKGYGSSILVTDKPLDDIFSEKIKESYVYLYEMDSDNFQQIEDTSEYFSTKEITEFKMEEITIGELIERLPELGITSEVNPHLKEEILEHYSQQEELQKKQAKLNQ